MGTTHFAGVSTSALNIKALAGIGANASAVTVTGIASGDTLLGCYAEQRGASGSGLDITDYLSVATNSDNLVTTVGTAIDSDQVLHVLFIDS